VKKPSLSLLWVVGAVSRSVMENRVKIPKGLTESETIDIINYIVTVLAPKSRFFTLSIDDIKQQGWVYAIDGLDKFDNSWKKDKNISTTEKLKSFLYIHVRNRLLNFKRDTLGRTCAKQNLLCAIDINIIDENQESNCRTNVIPEDFFHIKHIQEIILEYLPEEFHTDYNRMLEHHTVAKARKEEIYSLVREILEDIEWE
jgi:hypothetical protein